MWDALWVGGGWEGRVRWVDGELANHAGESDRGERVGPRWVLSLMLRWVSS